MSLIMKGNKIKTHMNIFLLATGQSPVDPDRSGIELRPPALTSRTRSVGSEQQ